MDAKKFYVYILARPDGTPFYVGKGQRDRVAHHERMTRRGKRGHLYDTIRKIWGNGGEVQRCIVFETNDEQEALNHEIALIAQYGRKNLCNHTDGGEGSSNPSEDVRARLRLRRKGEMTPERRARISEATKQRMSDPVRKAQHSAALRDKWRDAEYREKILQARKAKAQPKQKTRKSRSDPALLAHRSEMMQRRMSDPAERAKLSAKTAARYAAERAAREPTLAVVRAIIQANNTGQGAFRQRITGIANALAAAGYKPSTYHSVIAECLGCTVKTAIFIVFEWRQRNKASED